MRTHRRGTPPAMIALVEVSKLNPKQGEEGFIDCPRCGAHTFHWLRHGVSGKLGGGCQSCNLTMPRG